MKPHIIGILQALGLVTYIALFALAAYTFAPLIFPNVHDIFRIISFLLAFVTSALVCGALALFSPLHLLLKGDVRGSLLSIVWTIVSLFGGFLVVVCIAFILR